MYRTFQRLFFAAMLTCGATNSVTAQTQGTAVNNPPIVRDESVTYYMSEKAPGGTVIGTLIVVDKDKDESGEYEALTYQLVNVSGSDCAAVKNIVEIKEAENVNGVRKVNFLMKDGVTLDYLAKQKYVAYMTISDGVNTTNKISITLRVKNENDAPTISDASFTIGEKKADGTDWPAGTSVGEVTTASDPDGDQLSYSVVTTGVPFKFINGTNELVVSDGSVLDFETKPTWTFKVQVSDGEFTAQASVTVKLTDVNEPMSEPVLKNEYTVNENTASGTSIGTFEVFDPDANDELTYTLTGALPAGLKTTAKNLSDIFELKETKNTNGTRTVSINVKDASLLDYEKLYYGNASYQATITIADDADHQVTKTTNITIQDVNEKVTATGGTFYLNEHSPKGSPVSVETYKDENDNPLDCEKVARVRGSDFDLYNPAFSTLTYQIDASKNTGTDYTKFIVDKNIGRLYSNDEFDYETGQKKFTFVVTVSDGEFTADVEVTVKIDDITEPTISFDYDGDVAVREDAKKGDVVIDITEFLEVLKAKDNELKTNLEKIVGTPQFSIDQEASGNAEGIFTIKDGKVKVEDPTKLNFEALYPNKLTYTVVVVASGEDSNSEPVEVPINLKITVMDANEAPEINSASSENDPPNGVTKGTFDIFVPETWTNADDFFGKVVATDPDNAYGAQHPWGYNKLTYQVEEVIAVDGSTDFPFDLDPNTGKFTVEKGKELDYTKQKQYKCKVKVMDNPRVFDAEGHLVDQSQSTTETIVINVVDVNRPAEFRTFANPYEVEENVDIGAELEGGRIVVYDEDDADLDKLMISIADKDEADVSMLAQNFFEVVQEGKTDKTTHLSTFVIKARTGVDYEGLYKDEKSAALFNVTVTITDVGGNTTSKDTQIRIIDVNEEPALAKDAYEFAIPEDAAPETAVGVVEAMDPDIHNAKYGTRYYSLEGNDAAAFDINGSTGEISVSKSAKLDYETKKEYEFNAVVTDKRFTKKVPVTITVTDVDETPEFPAGPIELSVDENSAIGTVVGVVTAEDGDCKNNGHGKMPTYSLAASDVSANDYKSFSIDNSSGTIKVAHQPISDYETKYKYSVRVVATDGDDPTLSTFVDIIIMVNDVNEEPAFKSASYTYDAVATETTERVLGTVEATDPDIFNGPFSIFTYSLEGDDAANFKVDATTGAVSIVDGAKFDYVKSPTLSFNAVVADGELSTKVPVTVTLSPEPLAETDITVEQLTYTSKALLPVIKKGETTFVSGTDYSVTQPEGGCINAGDYSLTFTFTGVGNYSGEITKTFTILPKTVGLSWSETKTFDCTDAEMSFTATATGLEDDDVCNVVLSDHKATAVGKYTATATGLDNANYQLPTEGLTCDFEIVRKMEGLFAEGTVWTGYVAKEDLQLPDDLKAYTVSALESDAATVAGLDYIPQGEPVLLKRTNTEANLYRASAGTGTPPTTNLLKTNNEDKAVKAGECYLLYNDEFVLTSSGTLPAGCFYLSITGGTSRCLRIDEETTAVRAIKDVKEESWYDLNGCRLTAKPTKKGLYIHNGKKEVVR